MVLSSPAIMAENSWKESYGSKGSLGFCRTETPIPEGSAQALCTKAGRTGCPTPRGSRRREMALRTSQTFLHGPRLLGGSPWTGPWMSPRKDLVQAWGQRQTDSSGSRGYASGPCGTSMQEDGESWWGVRSLRSLPITKRTTSKEATVTAITARVV